MLWEELTAYFLFTTYWMSHAIVYPANHTLRDFITKKKFKEREEYEREYKEMILGH
jgi:hypothetical protein